MIKRYNAYVDGKYVGTLHADNMDKAFAMASAIWGAADLQVNRS